MTGGGHNHASKNHSLSSEVLLGSLCGSLWLSVWACVPYCLSFCQCWSVSVCLGKVFNQCLFLQCPSLFLFACLSVWDCVSGVWVCLCLRIAYEINHQKIRPKPRNSYKMLQTVRDPTITSHVSYLIFLVPIPHTSTDRGVIIHLPIYLYTSYYSTRCEPW